MKCVDCKFHKAFPTTNIHWCEATKKHRRISDEDVYVDAPCKVADRKDEPTMRLHEWTSDDITFCTAKCEVKCFRKPKHIKHKDIPHSFSDFSNSCVEYEPKDEPQTEDLQDWKDRMWTEAVEQSGKE